MAAIPASATDEIDYLALLTALKSLKNGDFSACLPTSWTGLAGKIAEAFNDMVEMNARLASELERLSRVVGTEGKINQVTDSVNSMGGNLTGELRNIADVTTAVANGDLSRKITVDVKGEILELKNTINSMVDQLSSAGAADEAALNPRRIVIVEDDEDAREMLKALLELASHEVHDASDGRAGIELVASVAPDIAFVDIGLPGIDGYEVARRLRERHTDLPLVALSGYGRSEDRRKAAEAGFDMHLLKPVDPERLSAIIAALPLRRRKQVANDCPGGGLA